MEKHWWGIRSYQRADGASIEAGAGTPALCTVTHSGTSVRQPSLAARSWTHQVQGCRPRIQGPPQLCTVVPCPVHLYIAHLPSRRGLRSSCSDCLVRPLVHRSTVDSRAYSVAGPQSINQSIFFRAPKSWPESWPT